MEGDGDKQTFLGPSLSLLEPSEESEEPDELEPSDEPLESSPDSATETIR